MWITDTFWTNPQYRVTVIDADEGDADDTGTLIVALLQNDPRFKLSEGMELLIIGYVIYKVSYRRPHSVLHQLPSPLRQETHMLSQALNHAMPHSRNQLEGVNRKELIFYFFYLKCTQNILSKTQQTIINGLYQTYIASRIVLFKVTT